VAGYSGRPVKGSVVSVFAPASVVKLKIRVPVSLEIFFIVLPFL
jgi:hypothetical protein